jgi:hypothetical protein
VYPDLKANQAGHWSSSQGTGCHHEISEVSWLDRAGGDVQVCHDRRHIPNSCEVRSISERDLFIVSWIVVKEPALRDVRNE